MFTVTEKEIAKAFDKISNSYIFFCRDIKKVVFMKLVPHGYPIDGFENDDLETVGCDDFTLQNYLDLL